MNALAALRPDSWDLPLFVHVLGAMVLVGGLASGASILAFARGSADLLRLGFWSLLALTLPGWLLMRVGAAWIASEEGWDDVADEPAWLELGTAISDVGGVVLLVSVGLGAIGVYRLRRGRGSGLLTATLVLSLALLTAYLVAVWAMAGKPD